MGLGAGEDCAESRGN